MENNRENLEQNTENKAEDKLQEDFDRLQRVAKILTELGFTVIDRFISISRLQDPTSEMGFPLVRDGANCIRASYSKQKGLKIWFTNKLENPENSERQEVENRLKSDGLI